LGKQKAYLVQSHVGNHRLLIMTLIVLCNFSLGLNFGSVAPVVPFLMEDFGIDRGEAGLIAGVGLGVMSLGGFFGGFIGIRIGYNRAVMIGCFIAGIGVFTPFVESFGGLLLLRLFLGIGAALIFPCLGPIIMRVFSKEHTSGASALTFAAFSGGLAGGFYITTWLAGSVSWQGAFSIVGGLLLGVASLWLLFRNSLQFLGNGQRAPLPSFQELRGALSSKVTLLMLFADAGPFAIYIGFTAWLPTFYHETLGISIAKGSFIVGLIPIFGVIGVLVGGLVQKSKIPQYYVLIGVLLCITSFGSFLIGHGLILYLTIAIMGFTAWTYIPTLMTLPMDHPEATEEHVALVWGLFMSIGGFVSFLVPFGIGTSVDIFESYYPGFIFLSTLSLTIIIAGLLINRVMSVPPALPRSRGDSP
jgi:cyanate permease